MQTQPALPASWMLCCLLVLAIGVYVVASKIGNRHVALPLKFLVGAIFGFAWAGLFAQYYLRQELPTQWEGRDITLIGTVDGLPSHFERGVGFTFAVESVLEQDGEMPVVPERLSLAWYRPATQTSSAPGDMAEANLPLIEAGSRWRLTVRLKRPHGNANPHLFDYEAWLLERNLRATGYVRSDQKQQLKNQLLTAFVLSPGNLIEAARSNLRDRILHALPDRRYAGVLVALVIGDQRAIDQSDWEVFNRTGVSHLVAISGLHITMIATLFAAVMGALWRRSFFTKARLPLLLPAQKVAALSGALAALVYVLLAGFGVPAQRTLYMLLVVALALWSGRIVSVSHVLCVALALVLLIDPWAVLWPGFWLSFFAVGVILYTGLGRMQPGAAEQASTAGNWWHGFKAAGMTQYAVTIGLLPLTILLFGRVSLIGPLANAVAIPVIGLAVTPLALAACVLPAPVSTWLLIAAHALVEQLAGLLGWLSALPFAVWQAAFPSPWTLAIALLATLWMLAPRGWPLRWLALCGWLPLLLDGGSRPGAGEVWVTALDVGQGMAVLVETPTQRLLYDTGPGYGGKSDAANRIIVPYLRARGIDALDVLIVSHADIDHSGGALSVMNHINVATVYSSLAATHPIVAAAADHRRCHEGQAWQWGGTRFEMLYPRLDHYAAQPAKKIDKPNAVSCTIKITHGDQAILLPGDIEALQEKELVASHAGQLKASVLLAPHHGSGTSSTAAFLNEVDPQIALFQAGYRNRFRHPKQQVLERYRELGIKIMRSDEDGAILLKFDTGLSAVAYREQHRRYWYGR
ncbi:DNA internalization-related competence protein ComEC/Rec2 [Collimonas sp. NPDC087041]|uniref:DNA internalization-related competence protein ComEC/Rec2 n=1 Tax=Collimonas sp. NPDC087041 TaxID=3363960 RepID=UPI0038215460